jgi:polyhydroxybutyrate depolymerase
MKSKTVTMAMGWLCAAALFDRVAFGAEGKSSDGTPAPWKSGVHHLVFGGIDRTFILDVPREVRPGAPLVMVFHGFTGSANGIRELAGFTPLVEKHGFVAVYPQGTTDSKGKSFFNVGYQFHRDQTVDDVGFARGLSARLVVDLGLEGRAVFATGFSNGGDMSFYLAAQRDPFVAAIAPVAGTMMESWARNFRPASRISVLAVNATHDQTTLWNGDMENRDGWGAYLGSEAVLDLWVKGLALPEMSRVAPIGNIRMTRWSSRTNNTEVKLYALGVGGHEWPRHLGEDSRPTAEVIWRFFDDHRPKAP